MSARSLNRVMLIGNLTRDPEMRYTPQGTAVCTFGLATNRSWTPADGGDRQEETEYHRIVSWAKLAEICSQLLYKGRKVYVEGRLQTRRFTGQDGNEREITEVVIDSMIALGAPKGKSAYGDEDAYSLEGYDQANARTTQTPAATQTASNDDANAPAPVTDDISSVLTDTEEAMAEKKKPAKSSKKEKSAEEVNADDIPF